MMEFHKVFNVVVESHIIFNFLNNIENLKKFSLLFWEHFTIQKLSRNRIGLGSIFKCSGRIFGKKLDFIFTTIQWIKNKKIIIHSFSSLEFTLIFNLNPLIGGTEVKIDLYYTLPFSYSRELDIILSNKIIYKRLNLVFNSIKNCVEYEYGSGLNNQQFPIPI